MVYGRCSIFFHELTALDSTWESVFGIALRKHDKARKPIYIHVYIIWWGWLQSTWSCLVVVEQRKHGWYLLVTLWKILEDLNRLWNRNSYLISFGAASFLSIVATSCTDKILHMSQDQGTPKCDAYHHLGGSINGAIPKQMAKKMENPMKKWMMWGYPYFRKPPFNHELPVDPPNRVFCTGDRNVMSASLQALRRSVVEGSLPNGSHWTWNDHLC